MKAVPQAILKEYVKSQNFTSTGEIMEAMKEMFRDVIQTVMEVELDEELGRERCQRAEASGDRSNYRNGHTKKTVKTQLGKVQIQVPWDRNGSFEPKIIGKYSRNADGMEEKILSLYSCGMSQRDIAEQIKELYDVEISPELVTKITEKIMPEVTAWQNRPLEAVYPFIFMDAIHYKVKEDHRYVTEINFSLLPSAAEMFMRQIDFPDNSQAALYNFTQSAYNDRIDYGEMASLPLFKHGKDDNDESFDDQRQSPHQWQYRHSPP